MHLGPYRGVMDHFCFEYFGLGPILEDIIKGLLSVNMNKLIWLVSALSIEGRTLHGGPLKFMTYTTFYIFLFHIRMGYITYWFLNLYISWLALCKMKHLSTICYFLLLSFWMKYIALLQASVYSAIFGDSLVWMNRLIFPSLLKVNHAPIFSFHYA